MKLEMSRVEYWRAQVEDRAGALADKLAPLAEAGVNLDLVIARRAPEQPGTGLVFVSVVKGAKQTRAAQNAGFEKAPDMFGLRLAVGNTAGLGEKVTRTLAEGGISLRAFAGQALAKQAILHVVFDNAADAIKAQRLLKKL